VPRKNRLLVVDDEPNVQYSLREGLESATLEVIAAETARQGLNAVQQQHPDAVILDVRLPDMSGLDVFEQIHRLEPHLPVIIATAYSTTETAIEAMKRGAFDYLLKPVDLASLRELVDRALEVSRLSRVAAVFDQEPPAQGRDSIIGRSPAMQQVYKDIGRVAPQDVAVMILGESGTGKELVARAIFQHSGRATRPFLAINCAAIPEALLESELFGHERGAFTGADRRRIGKFEQAHGGTLLLDEIGDMAPATQAKLLRVLQEQRFERVGGNETIGTDVRIIAATNQDLAHRVEVGKFRSDLFYRLNVFTIRLPPLRERTEDLPLLIQYFVQRFSSELAKKVHGVAPDAMTRIASYTWPGNVRELQNALKYSLLKTQGEVVSADSLPEFVLKRNDTSECNADKASHLVLLVRRLLDTAQPELYQTVIAEVDRIVLREALARARGSQVVAAELLGISRNTLRAKLCALNLSIEKQLAPDSEQEAQ
jgi:nitrogen regulation protein NR(I)